MIGIQYIKANKNLYPAGRNIGIVVVRVLEIGPGGIKVKSGLAQRKALRNC